MLTPMNNAPWRGRGARPGRNPTRHILSVNLTVRSSFQIVPADVSRVELNLRIIHFRRVIIVLLLAGVKTTLDRERGERERESFRVRESIRDARRNRRN